MNPSGKKTTAKDALRTSRRETAVATRGIERDIAALQSEEKKLVGEIKKTAKTGNEVRLDPDPFLNELTKLYEQHKDKGTVWVTLKRVHLDWKRKRKTSVESEDETVEYRCLARATDGKKNLSTMLSAKDHQRFQMAYATVLKAHMDALKKREKRDKKDKKAAAAASAVVKQATAGS